MLHLLIMVILNGILSPQQQQTETPFLTYQWKEIYCEKSFTATNRYIQFEGLGYYETKEERLRIIAFDTLPVTVKICESIKDTIKVVEQLTYCALPNPEFHQNWDTLAKGQKPTPITKNQALTFKNYTKYKLLHQQSPEFSVQSIYGEQFTQDSLINKITLLNFWFYGCMPCVAEIPALNKVAEYYKDHPKVQLLSFFRDSIYIDQELNVPKFQSTAIAIKDEKVIADGPYAIELNFIQMANSKDECDAFNVLAYPTNIIIDHTGQIHEIFVGASIKDNEHLKNNLIFKIDRLLEQLK